MSEWIDFEKQKPTEFKDYEVWNVYGRLQVSEWRPPLGGSWLTVEYVLFWREIEYPPGGLDSNRFWDKDKKDSEDDIPNQ